jgi:hypothetical protein
MIEKSGAPAKDREERTHLVICSEQFPSIHFSLVIFPAQCQLVDLFGEYLEGCQLSLLYTFFHLVLAWPSPHSSYLCSACVNALPEIK